MVYSISLYFYSPTDRLMLLSIFAIVNGIAKNRAIYVSFWTYARAVCKSFS